jgi:hypothetical protein
MRAAKPAFKECRSGDSKNRWETELRIESNQTSGHSDWQIGSVGWLEAEQSVLGTRMACEKVNRLAESPAIETESQLRI